MSYPEIAQFIYSMALLGLMGWSLLIAIRDPTVLSRLVYSSATLVWVALLPLIVLAVLLTGVAYLMGGEGSMKVLGPMLVATAVMLVLSLSAWPIMAQTDKFKDLSRVRRAAEFPIFIVVTLVWSLLALKLAEQAIDLEVSEDFLFAEVVESPWVEFLALTVFVVIIAALEEFIFRGGIQGALEKTRLGVPGAIIVASALWSLGHVGFLEPHGVKELQIFGLGVIFGIAKARHGLRWAVLLHAVNNLMAMLITGVEKAGW